MRLDEAATVTRPIFCAIRENLRHPLHRKTQAEVYTAKGRRLLRERRPVIHENVCDGIAVPLLTRKLEARHDAGVLVETGTFEKAAQRAFYQAFANQVPSRSSSLCRCQ
jgi:hypothetical protein